MTTSAVRVGRLIDGSGSEMIGASTILIDAGQIVDVRPGVAVPPTAMTYDFPHGVALPGLVDAHTHLVWAGDAVPHAWVSRHDDARISLRMAALAGANINAGITTVRDLGSTNALSIPLSRAIRDGDIVGPRVIPAGQAIAMTGGHAWHIAVEADGADAVRAAVRRQIKLGAECIKLMASGGVYDERAGLDEAQLTVEEMAAAVAEAHKAGLHVAAHAYAPLSINLALDAGVDSIEHGSFLDEATAVRMRDANVYLTPTLTASTLLVQNAEATGTPPHMVRKARTVRDAARAAVETAWRVGTPIAGGSDAGGAGITHGCYPLEIKLLYGLGLTVEQAIAVCTANSSRLLRTADVTGRVEAGLAADIVVFDQTALKNADFSKPLFVMLTGRPVTLV